MRPATNRWPEAIHINSNRPALTLCPQDMNPLTGNAPRDGGARSLYCYEWLTANITCCTPRLSQSRLSVAAAGGGDRQAGGSERAAYNSAGQRPANTRRPH